MDFHVDFAERENVSPVKTEEHKEKRSWGMRALNYVVGSDDDNKKREKKNTASSSHKSKALSTPLPNEVKFGVQALIIKEMKSPCMKSNILCMPKIFDSIMHKVIEAASASGTPNSKSDEKANHPINHRPIEIDLIQKVVGLINDELHQVNRELVDLDLALSGVAMERIHLLVVFYLTILYYNEQKQHFDEQIKTHNEQKNSLQQYFISVIVPDASLDIEGGKDLVTQVQSTLQRELTTRARTIIDKISLSQSGLSRKELQNVCDGMLLMAKTKWLTDYIHKPTDIIIEEFDRIWLTLKKEIERQIATEKNLLNKYLIDFFYLINVMHTALSGQGPAATFVDELFVNPSGTMADQNLRNKGQCMVLLLFSYLTNEKIDAETKFTVFDCTYKLTTKAVSYFQKLGKPDSETASFFDLMTKSCKLSSATLTNTTSVTTTIPGAAGTSLRLSSIKNFADFLSSIMSSEEQVLKYYKENISTLLSYYDQDKMYMRLLDKARGCSVKCKISCDLLLPHQTKIHSFILCGRPLLSTHM